MTESGEPRIEIDAAAKLNLGLEAIDPRDDGFHDIATIFVAIDLCDRLTLTPANDLELTCDDGALAGKDNLAFRALQLLHEETGYRGGARIHLRKRIPSAAGLGGASSAAAAALIGARDLWQSHRTRVLGEQCWQVPGPSRVPPLLSPTGGVPSGPRGRGVRASRGKTNSSPETRISDARLHDLAAQLGSDVPFFLRGGAAVGHGRGDILDPLPLPQDLWFVVVVPEVTIPRKTASLYARLRAQDFSDGSRVAAQAALLKAGLPLDPALLGNVFARPLYVLAPALAALPGIMREAGAASVAISGAGPAHYTFVSTAAQADSIAARLRDRLGNRARIFVARPAPARS